MRKIKLHPETKIYEAKFTHTIRKETRPNYQESVKKSGRRYWQKYKKRLILSNKKYQLDHLDKFREYNKKHRERFLARCNEQQRASYWRNRDKINERKRKNYREKHPIHGALTAKVKPCGVGQAGVGS